MQHQISFLDGQYTKMFREHSVRENRGERTSESSSKNLSKSVSRMPRCLRLTRGGGLTPTLSWVRDGALLTEFLMPNYGFPKEEREYTLSQVLEMNAPEKYYLSAKACEGILRRANKRGKKLPQMLEDALCQQITRMDE